MSAGPNEPSCKLELHTAPVHYVLLTVTASLLRRNTPETRSRLRAVRYVEASCLPYLRCGRTVPVPLPDGLHHLRERLLRKDRNSSSSIFLVK